MLYVYIALGLIVSLVLVVQLGGMMLPIKHSARVGRVISASPDEVWKALTDIENHPRWRSELISIERTSESPLRWVETSKFGEMPLQVETWDPPRKMMARIDAKGLPFGGTWTYELQPEGPDTRLTITEDGEVYPPAFRFLSKFVFGHTKTIEGYLAQLDAHLQKEAN